MRGSAKKICFRTKGDHVQGMGDVMGSLSMAAESRSRGHIIDFIIDNDKEAIDAVKKARFRFSAVKDDREEKALNGRRFDIVVVNQLITPFDRLSVIRRHCEKLVTIDDTGHASKILADLRINPLYYDKGALCDHKYVPLNPVFQRAHGSKKAIRSWIANILVTMGGSDTYGLTPQILEALSAVPGKVKIAVIIGPAFKHKVELKKAIADSGRQYKILHALDIKKMWRWIRWADVAICGAGNTLFEMACCGTPAIVVCNEPFEDETAYHLKRRGFGKVIPFNKRLNALKLQAFLSELGDKDIRRAQSKKGMRLVDGMGAIRIIDTILAL